MSLVSTSAKSSGSSSSAWTLLTTATISGSAAPFDVAGISGLYNDLLIVAIVRSTFAAANIDVELQLNNDSGNNYLWEMLEGTGASALAQSAGALTSFIRAGHAPGSTATASYAAHFEIIIPGYAGTTWNKIVNLSNAGTSGTGAAAQWVEHLQGMWVNTAAVTRIGLKADDGGAGNFAIGSTLRIYGRL